MKLIKDTRLELWIEALEQQRFPRATGALCQIVRGQPCFCPLGVAVEVYWEHNPDQIEFKIKHLSDGSWDRRTYVWDGGYAESWLPAPVCEWYGILPQGQLTRWFNFRGFKIRTIEGLNDKLNWSFQAIAGVIRRGYLERAFV